LALRLISEIGDGSKGLREESTDEKRQVGYAMPAPGVGV